ncbi:hypothetical protein HC891_05725, partial [Candidatus Gracilibacteria bacterium]|nr:hypothetical protein [Candidatus Gracilibacteria bacterium]
MQRSIFLGCLAALEATFFSTIALLLAGQLNVWPLCFGLVLFGRAADHVTTLSPPRADRPLLSAGAAIAGISAVSGFLGLAPAEAFAALVPGSATFGNAYLALLFGLLLYWRGTRLDALDGSAIFAYFTRSIGALVVLLLLSAVLPSAALGSDNQLLTHLLAFISFGLGALALAHARESGTTQRLTGRYAATLLGAITLIVLLSSVLGALVAGGGVLEVLRQAITLLLIPFALIGGALTWLLVTLIAEPLAALIRALFANVRPTPLPETPQQPQSWEIIEQPANEFIRNLAYGATWLMALIPLFALILAILLLRSRRAPSKAIDEERESLGLLVGLAADLRGLLGSLRNPLARQLSGLQHALTRLRADDPSTRVRRAYVRLLLDLERGAVARPPTRTPDEFAPTAAEATGHPQ